MGASSALDFAIAEPAYAERWHGSIRRVLPAIAGAVGLLAIWLLALLTSGNLADGTRGRVLDTHAKLPLSFVPNAGQVDESVRYHAQGPGFGIYFTRDKAVLSLTRGQRRMALHLTPLGTSERAKLEVRRRGTGRVNYLVGGERHTNLPTYREVVYRELWPGVDLVFRGQEAVLKYEFRLKPGADPSRIRLAYRGADGLSLGASGDLLIHTALGTLRDSRPRSYQQVGRKRVAVSSRYVLRREGSAYGFELGDSYDSRRPLVIDPGLAYSTYLGGPSFDRGSAIAVGADGGAYVTGETDSTTFPTTAGAYDRTSSSADAFVTKLNGSGSLSYSTFLGGSFSEVAGSIAVDGEGNAYVTGYTSSRDFPTAAGAHDPSFNGGSDVYVAKLNSSGSGLVYSTYLGGAGSDLGGDIAVDQAGAAYVTGDTFSDDFPTTAGAFDTTFNGSAAFHIDPFVTKLSTTGSQLVYSTYLGGETPFEGVDGIAVDQAGSAYVTGHTESTDFPTTPGAYDTTYNGGGDVFITKVNSSGSSLAYSTLLGGSGDVLGTSDDFSRDIAVDAGANAYVVGFTASADFPTTAGAYDTTFDGSGEEYITELNATGTGLRYSTFLADSIVGQGISVAPSREAYVAGGVASRGGDAAVVRLNATGSAINFSTSLGGSSSDLASAIALDPLGAIYITGETKSADFPTTPGAHDATANGGTDAFVAKIETAAGPGPPATLTLSPKSSTNIVGTRHCVTATVRDAAGNPAPDQVVRFRVRGSVSRSGSRTTNERGRATFCYMGPELPGSDTIRAFADTDKDGLQDPGEPANTATKTWVLPPTTPGCEIRIADGGRIRANNGDVATFSGNAKASPDGSVQGQQQYQDRGPAANLNVKSSAVQALICSADRKEATVFGRATINGAGSFSYKIEVQDLNEPGVDIDTYRILLSNGYDSGQHTLEAGNIQIHG